ncbi:MAG TPA: hypothetical protein VFT95_08525, partial [Micromonosporaceae bacterium]|nr:hypothetical protein [Micromonosporaceae bacterium]
MTTRSVRLPALSSVVASRIATLGVSLAVGVLTARALGPADRGRLALSLACSAVFAVACAAGLDTA